MHRKQPTLSTWSEVNKVLESIPVTNFTDLKNVSRVGALLICKNVEITGEQNKKAKEPFWKRKIKKYVNSLRKDLGKIDDWFKGRWKIDSAKVQKKLINKYKIEAEGCSTVIEELKESISAMILKLKHYTARAKQ